MAGLARLAGTTRQIPKLHEPISATQDDHDPTTFNVPNPSRPLNTVAIMSDGEVEVESPSGYAVLPKEVTDEIGSVKLFNKWSYEDVEIRDISLTYGSPISRMFFWRSGRW